MLSEVEASLFFPREERFLDKLGMTRFEVIGSFFQTL
jgi:hypothetical protein